MARKRDRAFALSMAVLFFITAFGFSFFVIWQLVHQNNSSSNSSSNAKNSTSNNKNKLQGTKLANFTPTNTVNSLQIIDQKIGTGATVKAGDTVTVDYTGAVAATGTIFQSSLDSGQPTSLSLKEVIPGWKQGIPGMKVGGTRRLLIPASLAYGASPPPSSGIPANANLVFDITLHNIGSK